MKRLLEWLDRRCNAERRARWLHDARAPLAAIVGLADLLIHDSGVCDREHLLAIKQMATGLLSTVDQRFSHERNMGERVLVVCDDERRRREWLSSLVEKGYRPFGARDALDALRQLSMETFDAVLIDAELRCLKPDLLERAIRSRPVMGDALQVAIVSPRDISPTARAPSPPARARARG